MKIRLGMVTLSVAVGLAVGQTPSPNPRPGDPAGPGEYLSQRENTKATPSPMPRQAPRPRRVAPHSLR